MNPYFDTNHLAGALLLVAVLCWGMRSSRSFVSIGRQTNQN